MTYKIARWNDLYENSETRKLVHLRWFPCPNKQDGLDYRKITVQKNACELFAAWILLLEVASKCQDRGILRKSPEAPGFSPDDLGLMTGFPVEIFQKAYKFFSCKDIGWLEIESPGIPGESPGTPGESPAVLNGREGIEEKRIERKESPPAPLSDLDKTLLEFYDMRKKIKKPATDKAKELILKELDSLAPNNEVLKIQILNQSIINGWQDVYPIKDKSGFRGGYKYEKPDLPVIEMTREEARKAGIKI